MPPTAPSAPFRPQPACAAVSILGLGAMGSALARSFLAAGHPTTVWNRTAARAEPLSAAGAAMAESPAAAAAASELTIMCLLDTASVEPHLGALASTMTTVVNLTSSTPEEARHLADRAATHGLPYLEGAIMVPTPLIGTDEAWVLYSGDVALFERHAESLRSIGGDAEHLGEDPGAAALLDLAMLDVFFTGMTSFLHAAALVRADGRTARGFVPYADRILNVLRYSIDGLAQAADAGVHPGDEDTLAMELRALEHIVTTSEARGIDPATPELTRSLVGRAVAAGYGADGFSRVVELLRR